jgi:hypothetical protein
MERTPLQEAVWFFYERLGHRFPAPDWGEQREDVCAICGTEGQGYDDERPNHRIFRCLACTSFYAPAPDHFLTTGKDRSFAGIVKNPWVLDANGRFRSPIGKASRKDDAFVVNARAHGMDFYSAENPFQTLYRGIYDGEFAFPLLFVRLGQNKIESMRMMRLSTSDMLFFWDKSEMRTFDLALVREAGRLPLGEKPWSDWAKRGIPEDLAERVRFLKDVRGKAPFRVLTMHGDNRLFLRQVVDREEAKRPRPRRKRGAENEDSGRRSTAQEGLGHLVG